MIEFMTRLLPDLDSLFETGFDVTARATIVLLLAALVAFWLHRSPAAMRHLIWSASIVGVLVMPVLVAIAPLSFHLPEAIAPATVEQPATTGALPCVVSFVDQTCLSFGDTTDVVHPLRSASWR